MVGYHDRVGPLGHGAARVISRKNTLDDDRAFPAFPDPAEVVPGHHRPFQGRADIGVGHRTLAWQHHVGKCHQASVGQEAREPSRAHEEL